MVNNEKNKTAIIIGAGPAGLTAAYELLKNTDIKPIILEMSDYMGGISRTVRFGENKIDIGGHRFFSKSDKVIDWWLNILPLDNSTENEFHIMYQNKVKKIDGDGLLADQNSDNIMLVRERKSRIFYNKKFFDYPIKLSFETIKNLGIVKTLKIGFSYMKSVLFKKRKEENLEDFFINRFGTELYETFFKSYTEKVWGKPCTEIGADWGAQRVKGLSIFKAIKHSISKRFHKLDVRQKSTETSLIERFLYPKHGPGHMWERVAELVKEMGGEIVTNTCVTKLKYENGNIVGVSAKNIKGMNETVFSSDYVFSTMPVKELFGGFQGDPVPEKAKDVAVNLQYRDFITVGVLVRKLNMDSITDNWIYIHDETVHVGRIQFFNNWSPYMVKTKDTILIGLEYFTTEGDDFWKKSDEELKKIAVFELVSLGIILEEDVVEETVIRMKKAYPVYSGTYSDFGEVKKFIDEIPNLFLIGRNGMHRYNNQDHSMLSAMHAVACIQGNASKSDIWGINAEDEYHEEKK